MYLDNWIREKLRVVVMSIYEGFN